MFSFLKKILGEKTCCGNCCEALSAQEDLHLTDQDMETLRKLDERIVIGKVISREDHPDPKMTKVKVTKTDIGGGKEETILCGGVNLEAGDVVAVATVGAKLSEDFEIGAREIRGVESQGMICARSELGLSLNGESKGCIWKLPEGYISMLGRPLREL